MRNWVLLNYKYWGNTTGTWVSLKWLVLPNLAFGMTKKLLKLQILEKEEKSENIDFSTWKVEEAEIPAMMPALFSLAMS